MPEISASRIWSYESFLSTLSHCMSVKVKHAFITRFNELPSTVYRDYTVSLAYDMTQTRRETAFSDPSDLVARRMSFIPLPLGVAMARVLCTTLTPSARPANIILLLLAYLILMALRILNSLIILGKACDIISHTQTEKNNVSAKSPSHKRANSADMKNPNLGTAILSNSAVSLNNVCLNEVFLNTEETHKVEKAQCNNADEFTGAAKTSVLRTGSEPLLPQWQIFSAIKVRWFLFFIYELYIFSVVHT